MPTLAGRDLRVSTEPKGNGSSARLWGREEKNMRVGVEKEDRG